MSLDHLWAGWRAAYLAAATATGSAPGARDLGDGTLFERILRLDDEEGLVVHRGTDASVLLNAYPYTNGHVLVLPNVAAARLDDLADDVHRELWELVRASVSAVERAYRCEGVNVGMNLGEAAGAGVPDHLHVHVLPRWSGDTNFMTAVADTRVLPEPLRGTWERVRAAWPT